jgi:methyl coenzyme M reductase beta subunit
MSLWTGTDPARGRGRDGRGGGTRKRAILPNEPKVKAGSGFWLQNWVAARAGVVAATEAPRAMRAQALELVEACAAGDLAPAVGLVRRLGLCGEAAAAPAG